MDQIIWKRRSGRRPAAGSSGARRGRGTGWWLAGLALAAGGCVLITSAAAASPAEAGRPVPPAAAGGLSLERIHADPRLDGVPPREISWSPTAPVVAFLWSNRGRRERDLWVHEAVTGTTGRLTDVAELASPGQTAADEATAERRETMRLVESGVDSYTWAPDGNLLVFTLQGDLFSVPEAGGVPRRLTSTPEPEFDPRLSPDGRHLAFVRGNDLHVMSLEGGETRPVTSGGSETLLNGLSDYIALEELSRQSAYTWSGDGRWLVYIQADTSPVRQLEIPSYLGRYVSHRLQRRPPAGEANAVTRLGVVAASGGETRWVELQPGVEDFYLPLLRTMGDRVAVLQEERSLKRAHLFLVDPGRARARRVMEETDEAWINLDRLFIESDPADGTVVWTSERSGRAHLYRLDPADGTLSALTRGTWEVTELDRVEHGRAWFLATKEAPRERHLYSVPLAGGEPEKLTAMPGWNQAKVSRGGDWMAVLHSDVTRPPDLYVGRPGAEDPPRRITRSQAEDFADLDLPGPEFITLRSRADGAPIAAALYRPGKTEAAGALGRGRRPHPAVVHVHGAGYAQTVRRRWGGWRAFIHALFAKQGYYVLDVDYRGSRGYGRTWRTGVHLALGGPDLEDTVTAAEYLRSLPDVAPGRIGIWGWSYGGFLSAMAMMARPGVFDAGVAVAPVADWAAYDTHYTEERLGRPQDHPEAYAKGSPITYVSGLRDPLLLVHGLLDDNVHAQDTMRLVDALVREGKSFDLMVYPEARHGIRRDESRIHLWRKVFRFFKEKMPPSR